MAYNLKMPPHLYAELLRAMILTADLSDFAGTANTTRKRWDILWRAVDAKHLDLNKFYNADLNDSHIDSALRRIFSI